jgi:hypothetical protein
MVSCISMDDIELGTGLTGGPIRALVFPLFDNVKRAADSDQVGRHLCKQRARIR